jgi:NAD(P)-dependent dehydrogenase (short-subunit alcohol dehydrogenase family)
MLLKDKVALISGIGPGMGRDIALLFAEHGAAVVLGARTEARVEAVADEIRAAGGTALAVRLDITDRASCDAAVAAAVAGHGRLDVLVNNAFQDGDFSTFERADLDNWRTTMDTNLFGTLQLTQAAIAPMKEQHDGRVVMINTMSAHRIQPRYGAYAASKAALAVATKTLALELGGYGIRVNGIHPGYIWGDSVEQFFAYQAGKRGVSPQDIYDEVAGQTALGYIPTSAEIAGSVLFFASDLSKPVTGQALAVNAGHWFVP